MTIANSVDGEDGKLPTAGEQPEDAGGEGPELSFSRISDIARLPEGGRWLVEGFLSCSSLTVLASTPKTGKTWFCLALAVAIASGRPALGCYHVPEPGPVLLFPAEDDPRAIRERIESLCLGQGIEFAALPIDVITQDSLRLDEESDRARLERLLEQLRPKFLVLDPLVRLHSGAESYVGHIAELFGYLRTLQRRFELSILVTHHVAKNRSGNAQPGSAMRGSGDIHAAYDHGGTLVRLEDGSVRLALEHRSAPAPDPVVFRLHSTPGAGTTFELLDVDLEEAVSSRTKAVGESRRVVPTQVLALSLEQRVLQLLSPSHAISQVAIRRELKVRNETLTGLLRDLQQAGQVENLGRMKGWRLTTPEEQQEGQGR